MLFDDDIVTVCILLWTLSRACQKIELTALQSTKSINEDEIQRYFGDLPGTGSGYVLFYQAVNLNMDAVGMPAANGPNGVPQHSLNHQNGDMDFKLYSEETSRSSTPNYHTSDSKLDSPRGFAHTHTREDISSSTDSSVNGFTAVPEERRSRWGLRKSRKDSTKEKR